MRRLFFMGVGFTIMIAIAMTSYASGSDVEVALQTGGKKYIGVVDWAGTYNFFLITNEGQRLEFLINGETNYEPKNKRLRKESVVEVVCYEPETAGNCVIDKIVAYVNIVSEEPAVMPEGKWIKAIFTQAKIREHYVMYLPEFKKTIKVENLRSQIEYYNNDNMLIGKSITTEAGKSIQIKIKVVPQSPGGSYAYVATGVDQ